MAIDYVSPYKQISFDNNYKNFQVHFSEKQEFVLCGIGD